MSRPLAVIATVVTLALAALAGGCTPYRMDIAQGNVITQEMIDQLRPGMTRNQVRFILGTPMVADPFHADRWDYYYSLRRGSEKEPQTRHIAVFFKNGTLASIEGDVSTKDANKLPASADGKNPNS